MTQPTHTTQLTTRPKADARRPQLMAALALAETIVAFGEPVPHDVHLHSTRNGVSVDIHLYNTIPGVLAYQARFGGIIHQELRVDSGRVRLHTELSGLVYDGQFRAYTQTVLSERELAAWFVGDHGDPADWAVETAAAYRLAIAACRAEAAR
jgi:hypothetical protein